MARYLVQFHWTASRSRDERLNSRHSRSEAHNAMAEADLACLPPILAVWGEAV